MSGWREDYLRRYARLKEEGRPFFPHAVLKDAAVACLVLAALVLLALYAGPALEDPADPTDSTYNPRPEWYFLFLFQALKSFPGRLEPVAAVVLPALAAALLLALPFLDRGPARHPLDRPFWSGLGAAALAGFGWLTWAGWRSPMTNPVVARDPQVTAGRALFRDLRCAYCHKVGGQGGALGPALDKAGRDRTPDWLVGHLRDPQSVVPGSAMPRLNLLDDEIRALAAYLRSLGGEEPFTEEAPRLFAEHCAACHSVGGRGGDSGPDLSLIGAARDSAFLHRYIADPAALNPDSAMPGYKGQLTDVQLEDLARYLASLGR